MGGTVAGSMHFTNNKIKYLGYKTIGIDFPGYHREVRIF
jgi:hypothetical protein